MVYSVSFDKSDALGAGVPIYTMDGDSVKAVSLGSNDTSPTAVVPSLVLSAATPERLDLVEDEARQHEDDGECAIAIVPSPSLWAQALLGLREAEGGGEEEAGLNADDIDMVMKTVGGCTRKQAVQALRKNNGDLVNSIMDVSLELNAGS